MRRSSMRGDKSQLFKKEQKEEALHFGLNLMRDDDLLMVRNSFSWLGYFGEMLMAQSEKKLDLQALSSSPITLSTSEPSIRLFA